MHRFHAPDASSASSVVALPPDEAHHLTRVLRLAPGAAVRVFDGRGDEWEARVASVARAATTVELHARVNAVAEPPVHLTLAIGILKGDQMDAVIRDATMLGAAAIVPLASAHVSVPERAWRRPEARERWQRVALASVKQCGRAMLPEIAPPQSLEALLPLHATRGVIAVEPARGAVVPPQPATEPPPKRAVLLVGPEGGWSAAEVEQAIAAGLEPLSLGPRTLRAETAPTVALSLLWARWGWT